MMNQPDDPIVQQSFTRGELLLVVDHDPEMDSAAIAAALRTALEPALTSIRESKRENEGRLIPLLEQSARKNKYDDLPEDLSNLIDSARDRLAERSWGNLEKSLDGLAAGETGTINTMPALAADRRRSFIRLPNSLDNSVDSNTNDEKQANDLATAYLAAELHAFAERPGRERGGDFELVAVSPSWLFGGQMGGLTTGGPGALPVLPDNVKFLHQVDLNVRLLPGKTNAALALGRPGLSGKTVITVEKNDLDEKYTQAGSAARKNEGPLPAVHVFVLDTLPPRQVLVNARRRITGNDVLQTLLGPILDSTEAVDMENGGLVEICYYEPADPLFAADPHGLEGIMFDKIMVNLQDHGPFIVSLIYGAAPAARQHLFQVLNDYGIGTTASLIWGIQKVLESINDLVAKEQKAVKKRGNVKDHILVNCSLTVNYRPPAAGDPRIREPHETLLDWLVEFLEYSWLVKPIEALYALLEDEMVFAAAGNDSHAGSPKQKTGFPAAFDSVVGVGALNRDFSETDYTNKADNPANQGFVAVGGNVANNVELADSQRGLLGIYVSERFPANNMDDPASGPPNVYGWARWAGSSFATGLATGVTARLCTLESRPIALNRLRAVIFEGLGNYQYLPADQGQ